MVWYDKSEEKAVLVGVVSKGYGCGLIAYHSLGGLEAPSQFAKVDHFLPWIEDQMNKHTEV